MQAIDVDLQHMESALACPDFKSRQQEPAMTPD
jgi:hypothetical protein